MSTIPLRSATAGLLLVALVGCSGDPGTAADDPAASGSAAEPQPSPLDEFLGGARTGDQQEADRQVQLEVEAAVATCMQEAGFEYTPVDPEQLMGGFVSFSDTDQRDPEWVSRYGYGISTMDLQAPDLSDDPNNARVEAMTEAERTAYFEALYGTGDGGTFSVVGGGAAVQAAPPMAAPGTAPSGDGPTDGAPPEPATPGCFQQADTEVRGERPAVDPETFQDMFDALGELEKSVEADPRLAEAISTWSACMADAGHPNLRKVAEAQDVIFQQWADLNGWEVSSGGGGGGFAVTAQAVDDVPQLDPEQHGKLKNDEIIMATDDLGCRGDYDSIRDTVRVELETAFVEAHRAELEQFRDTMGR